MRRFIWVWIAIDSILKYGLILPRFLSAIKALRLIGLTWMFGLTIINPAMGVQGDIARRRYRYGTA